MTNFVKKSEYENMKKQRDKLFDQMVKMEGSLQNLLIRLERQLETGNVEGAKTLISHTQEKLKIGG